MQSDTSTKAHRLRLGAELAILFFALPIGLFFVRREFSRLIIPVLLIAAAAGTMVLLRDPTFDRRRFGMGSRNRGRSLRRCLLLFLVGGTAVSLLTAWLRPDLLFRLPRENPSLWIAVLLLYPLLSVYPQEVIFRALLEHRYRSVLSTTLAFVITSGVTFGLAHLFFANPLAPTMALVGGLMFAYTYHETGSTLMASLEHALWGDLLFTIGLGWYFYGGSVRV